VGGRIVNENGEPIAGASIKVKGTDKGTSTNDNGEFTLRDIDANAILEISGTNIETVEVKVSGKTDLETLAVKTRVTEGEQVVINTGYSKISSERFVGSYSQLNNAAYERRAGMDIISRLDGQVTGILFDKKSSSNDLLQNIQIRGVSTLGNANKEPLVVVDNFPFKQDLSVLNPNDVESIVVLKDAAATSIWGAQAGNGVIVITTKKGKYNQPMRLSVGSNITIREKPDLYYYPQIPTSDLVDLELFLFKNGKYDGDLNNTSSWPAISPVVEVLAKRRASKISALDSATQIDAFRELDLRQDLNKYVNRQSVSQQHYINLSGGNNLFNYSFSGGYNRSINSIQNSRPDQQFTINSNAGFRPINNLEISTGINYSHDIQKRASFSMPRAYSYSQLADAEGHPLALANSMRLAYIDTAGGGKLLDWRYRPLEEIGLSDVTLMTRFIALNIAISYRFTSWLNLSASYQYTNQSGDNRTFNSLQTYVTRDLINQFTNFSQTNPDMRYPVPMGGILDTKHSESKSQNARGQLNFNKNIGSNHSITALAAAEISETRASANGSRLYGYNTETGSYKSGIDYASFFPTYAGLQGSQKIPNSTGADPILINRFVSFLGNASYTYKGRYSFYASARKDGSNFFGVNTNRRWKPLWSAGSSWDISKENFFKIKWVSSLRFRASYGYSGNPGNVTGLPTMTYAANPDPRSGLLFAQLNAPPNPDLRWEKVRFINQALDFSLFNNRLSGSIDVYQKKVTDLISGAPLPPSVGVLTITKNIASMKGNGFEINLVSKNVNGIFSWQTSFGLSYAKMIVTEVLIGRNYTYKANDFLAYALNAAQGRIVYGLSSFKWAGLDPLTGDPRGYLNKQVSSNYNALVNDTLDNQVFHGSAIPLFSGFIGNTVNWKNFSLSFTINYRLNFYFRKPTINYRTLVTNLSGHADYLSRWQQAGDEKSTTVPSFIYPVDANRDFFYQYSEINVLRGDNIRLQDIRLQYTLNSGNLKKMPFKSLQAFVYVNNLNLILWRKNKSNLDPDVVEGGSASAIPTPRSWAVGMNLSF